MPAPRSAASMSKNSSISVWLEDLLWRAMRMIPRRRWCGGSEVPGH
jgi:hypothetical protein